MTPEGKVKQKIKVVLETYREQGVLYYYMNVPVGYGKSTLVYLGFLLGFGFAIEAKAPDKKPSERQLGIIEDIARSQTPVFIIDGIPALTKFNDWCQTIIELHRH